MNNIDKIFYKTTEYTKTDEGVEYFRTIFVYLNKCIDLSEEEVKTIFQERTETIKDMALSTYDLFINKGKEQ